MNRDEKWMTLALQLARKGIGKVNPGACVGAVLVRGNKKLGQGYHQRPGGPHAEILAFRNAKRNGFSSKGATLYVTLEPCCTHGRTPPCTDAIIKSGVKRVVVAATDPNPQHRGKGFRILKKAGVEVVSGVLAEEATYLNRAFNHWITTGKPWIVAKVAMSLDGKLTRPPGQGQWLTGPQARKDVHRLRSQCDAILVGAETIRRDNPQLTVRGIKVKDQPYRVIVTRSGQIPTTAKVLTDQWKERTLVFQKKRWESIFRELGKRGVMQVLVEGGGNVLNQLVQKKWINECYLYYAPVVFGKKNDKALVSAERLRELKLERASLERIGIDLRLHGIVKNPLST